MKTTIGKKGKPVAYDYQKYREHYLKNREKIIAYKKEHQAKHALRYRKYKKVWRDNNKEYVNAQCSDWHKKHFFMMKAAKLTGSTDCSRKLSVGLMGIWLNQRGVCALSGRKLDSTAHLDHRMPRSRGGSDELSNLQFLSPEVNMAKSNMTDEEFIKLCLEVVNNSKHR